MHIDYRIFSLPLGVVLLISATPLAASENQRQVGVAKVDITPTYPVRLNGYGHRREESEGVTQRIWAKALAIGSDDELPLVLIAIDSLGIRLSMVEEVASRLNERAGIKRARVAVTFTHSHTTPMVTGACDTIFSTPIPPEHQQRIDRYTQQLTDWLEEAALAALADREPAELYWAIGEVGFASNRRTAGGPVDHDLPMLVAKSPDGSIRAIYVSYACHCVTLTLNQISGDWAGYAQEAIERNHPGAVALVSIGCGSDANPEPRGDGTNIALAAKQGAQIADEVERLLRGSLRPVTGPVVAKLRHIQLPLRDAPTREELEALAAGEGPAAYNAQYHLAKLDQGEPLLQAIDYPIQSWAFADSLAIVFLAGEVCVDYAHRLKAELAADRCWINGYSNDFCGYIPSERLLREGGYGGGSEIVYFALPAPLAPGLEDAIVDEVHRQLPQFSRRAPDGRGNGNGPRTPEEGLQAIRVADGLEVELMAAEPLVADPVAIDFGPDGALWVVEMPDYSRDVDEEFSPTGRVTVLRDTRGDGRFDAVDVFCDGLRFPTDVKWWRDGVLVCDAPDVIYFADTNGDGRADTRKVLLTGFATSNAQARVNSLRLGLDHWIYGSCGLLGGIVTSHTGQRLELAARDFRFHPDTGAIEAVTGRTQQGRTRDDWGNWFGCENGVLARHYVLSDRHLARNPSVAPPRVTVNVLEGREATRLFPIAPPLLFEQSGPPGYPTSACGLECYRDDLLGEGFADNLFVAEPVNQVVRRIVLSPQGATFRGGRAEQESDREFLASTEPWFRPVQIRSGPDGCLWVVDMQRLVIEHPRFISAATLAELDQFAGRNMGRIYRVRPKSRRPRDVPPLTELDANELVAALESPNGTRRDQAHELLLRQSPEAIETELVRLATRSKRPTARLHALCVLEGIGRLSNQVLLKALSDSHSGVRRHAVRLAESFALESEEVDIQLETLARQETDPQVQIQLAYCLGERTGPRTVGALKTLAVRCGQKGGFLTSAILSSVNERNIQPLLEEFVVGTPEAEIRVAFAVSLVRTLARIGNEGAIAETAEALANPPGCALATWRLDCLTQLAAALRQRSGTLPSQAELLATAWEIVSDEGAADARRRSALRLVRQLAPDAQETWQDIGTLLRSQPPLALQREAIDILSGTAQDHATEVLLEHWHDCPAELRPQLLGVLLEREDAVSGLLDQLVTGDIRPAEIDAVRREQLLTHADAAIREQATSVFAAFYDTSRQQVVDRYRHVDPRAGSAASGRSIFQEHCAACHRAEGEGREVGPDLTALTDRAPAGLLEAIFDPNRAVDERYQAHLVIGLDGTVRTGLLAEETATSVTLRGQQGEEWTILRDEIDEMIESEKSIMPEGFENDLTPSDVADLLAYLASIGREPRQFAGNRPAAIVEDEQGAVELLATNGEIYGDEIRFERTFQNIGYWHDEQDHVAWEVSLEREGQFFVELDFACADESAGNRFVVEGGAASLRGTVPATGGYDRYELVRLGVIQLKAGRHRMVLRPDGPLQKTNLMDLYGLRLSRVKPKSDDDAVTAESPSESPDAAATIAELLAGIAIGTEEERQQIPAIWRQAIDAGKRNDAEEILRVLEQALPQHGDPLREWQAVVLGGGIVNGMSQAGDWPKVRLGELLRFRPELRSRWWRAVQLASAMADEQAVPPPTRYDALRMLGAGHWDDWSQQLRRYLKQSDNHELQQGAVSGLGDVQRPEAAASLLAQMPRLTERNRNLAAEQLIRSDERAAMLLDAVEAGDVAGDLLPPDIVQRLRDHSHPRLRQRARGLFELP